MLGDIPSGYILPSRLGGPHSWLFRKRRKFLPSAEEIGEIPL